VGDDMRSVFLRLVTCAAVTACALDVDPGAQAQTSSATPRSQFIDFGKAPRAGAWKPMCPQLVLPAQLGGEEQTSIKVVGRDGTIVGAAAMPTGGAISTCPRRGSKPWLQTVSVAPASMQVDKYGNVLYAGSASGSSGTFVGVGLLTPSGGKAWEHWVDGPGNESDAVVKVLSKPFGGVHVFGSSTGSLPTQPSTAKGHRFIAKYSLDGKQAWLRQSVDFGKPTTHEDNLADRTPSAFSVDALGNVYVVATVAAAGKSPNGQVTLANVTKLDRNGKKVWRERITVDVSSLEDPDLSFTEITEIAVSEDAKSVYLVGKSSGRGEKIVIIKIDSRGRQKWSELVSISYSERGVDDEGTRFSYGADPMSLRGAIVRGDTLYVLSTYHNFFYEYGEDFESKDYENLAVVAAFQTRDGRLSWVREFRSGRPSAVLTSGLQILPAGPLIIAGYDNFVSTLFLVTDVQAARAAPEPPPSPAPPPVPVPLPEVGDLVADGTILGGVSPGTAESFYTTAASATAPHTWSNAVNYCKALRANGYDDWRLPTGGAKSGGELGALYENREKGELKGTLEGSASADPGKWFWSSTHDKSQYHDGAWAQTFRAGWSQGVMKNATASVRCVRN